MDPTKINPTFMFSPTVLDVENRFANLENMWKKYYWILPTSVFLNAFFTIKCIKGRSMTPTLNPPDDTERDIVLVLKTQDVEINDICVLKHPNDASLTLVKRIRGLQGDWAYYDNKGTTVPEGFAFVQSDEPFETTDSRSFGPVPRGLIVGRVLGVIWPLGHLKWF